MRYQSYNICLFACFFLLQACKKDSISSNENSIAAFEFSKEKNPSLVYDIAGEIIGDTIFAYTFAGTDISGLIPDFDHKGKEVLVDGIIQVSGNDSQDFTELVKYEVKAENNSAHTYTVKFQDTGLPAIYVSTGGREIANREDYVEGSIRIVKGFLDEEAFVGDLEIRGRGNSTWGMPKRPFRLRLKEQAILLGMPANRHWALIANYADKSLLRNDIAFELSRRLELEYTPRQQYADLFLNGAYMGNYNLTEHIRQGSDRVNIDQENGGYILEADGYAYEEPVYFVTPQGMPITVKFPDEDDIRQDQIAYITNYYTAFENALFSDAFSDPDAGYQQYFDMATFVNYYLVNEICGNPDMFWSMRMYKKSSNDPKIYTGPVWDFDLAFNNDNRLNDAIMKLMLTDAHAPRQWINRFGQDPQFKKAVRDRWNAVKSDKIQTINDYVDIRSQQLERSQHYNFMRWDILQDPNIHLNWYVGNTYGDYVDFLKNYLSVRIAWLDDVINSPQFGGE